MASDLDVRNVFIRLRNVLATLYPSTQDSQRVVSDADLNPSRIAFDLRPINTWQNILTEAIKESRLDALLEIAHIEYENYEPFQKAYKQYQELLDTGIRIESLLDTKVPNGLESIHASNGTIERTPQSQIPDSPPSAIPGRLSWIHFTIGFLFIVGLIITFQILIWADVIVVPSFVSLPEALTTVDAPDSMPTQPTSGSTWVNPIDKATYVFVPAGKFIMGNKGKEHPVGEFWIMQTEVTNEQYAQCVEAKRQTGDGCTEPENNRWNDPKYADHPVTHINWYRASEYADWVGSRLPTEEEWEKACRGGVYLDGDVRIQSANLHSTRIYPWGNESPNENLLNFDKFDNNAGDTSPVGSYSPQGDSPYGVADMAGNVWEWMAARYDDEQIMLVLRGGSFFNHDNVQCVTRNGSNPNDVSRGIGFRVVWSHGS